MSAKHQNLKKQSDAYDKLLRDIQKEKLTEYGKEIFSALSRKF